MEKEKRFKKILPLAGIAALVLSVLDVVGNFFRDTYVYGTGKHCIRFSLGNLFSVRGMIELILNIVPPLILLFVVKNIFTGKKNTVFFAAVPGIYALTDGISIVLNYRISIIYLIFGIFIFAAYAFVCISVLFKIKPKVFVLVFAAVMGLPMLAYLCYFLVVGINAYLMQGYYAYFVNGLLDALSNITFAAVVGMYALDNADELVPLNVPVKLSGAGADPATELRNLQADLQNGFITEEEFAERRAEIIKRL